MKNKIAFLVPFYLSVATPAFAIDYNSVWIGPDKEIWSDANNWNTPTPDNTLTDTFAVSIDGKEGSGYTVKLDQNATITSLFIGSGDLLDISSGFSLTVNSDVIGSGIINTESSSSLILYGLLDGITHTGGSGADSSSLTVSGGTLRNVTNSSGVLLVDGSLLDGTVTNNATLNVSGAANSFANVTIDGTGVIDGVSGTAVFTAAGAGSTLSIAGDQTLGGTMNTTGGQVIVNGLLNADAAIADFASNVSGTGTINTVNNTSFIVRSSTLEGITHTGGSGTDSSSLIVEDGTLRNMTNSSGTLLVANSQLDGIITNNATLNVSGAANSFANATIDGTGVIDGVSGTAVFTAAGAGSTLSIAGDQTLGGTMNITGGQVIVNGLLNADAAIADFASNVSGTGTINTVNNTSFIVRSSTLEGITHTGGSGTDSSSLIVEDGTLRNMTNSSGTLLVANSQLDGIITNNATLNVSGAANSFANATIDGTGFILDAGLFGSTFTAADPGSTLIIAGDQTLGGTMNTTGGQVIVNGLLNADAAIADFASNVSGTGTINTVNNTSFIVRSSTLEGITHTGGSGTDSSSLIVEDGTLRNMTNSSGTLLVANSQLDGIITNNATLNVSGVANSFANATIDGTGFILDAGLFGSTFTAADPGSTLIIAGDQTLGGTMNTTGGQVIVNGLLNADAAIADFASNVSGTGTINTDNSSRVSVLNSTLEGITHTGNASSSLDLVGGTLINVTNNSGLLTLSNSLLDGLITNNANLEITGVAGGFANATIDGTGNITSVGTGTTLTATNTGSNLTIAGIQTLTGGLDTFGGEVIVNGTLNADGALSVFNSDVSGIGTINTVNGTSLEVIGVLEGITHTGGNGSDISGLGVSNGVLRNITNSSGRLAAVNSLLDGLITNNADLLLLGASGTFANTTINGVGIINSVSSGTALTATGTLNTLTINGDQTLLGSLDTFGGHVIINGLLNADGSTALFNSDVAGAGTINTINGSSLDVQGHALEGITHTGDGASLLNVVSGTLRNVTNSSGVLEINDSTLEGQITNQATATITTAGGADLIKVVSATHLTNDGQIDGNLMVDESGILSGSGLLSGDLDILSGGIFTSDNTAGAFSVEGVATLGGELQFDWLGADPDVGDYFDLMYADTILGEFDLLSLAILGNGLDWRLDYLIDFDGTTDYLQLSVVSAVPVPGAVWLFGSGIVVLMGFARRKKA